MSGASVRQLVPGLLVLALCAVLIALIFALKRRERKKRTEIIESFVGRFGVVRVTSSWGAVHMVLEKPTWGGIVRVHGGGIRLFDNILFVGTTSQPCPPWSIVSRRYAVESKGAPVPDTGDEVRKRYLVRAERPDAVRAFFDDEMQRTLVELDAGLLHALVGAGVPGLSASVCGATVSVSVTGQAGDEEEQHLERALALIERISRHAAGVQTTATDLCAACGEVTSGPGAPVPCERCGARHHAACWDDLGGCRVWGCGDRERLLDAIRRRYFVQYGFPGQGAGGG